jgi:ATP-binding cassette subfamily F protein uup
MDKLVEHYFVFEGEGQIDDHHGSYEEYLKKRKEREAEAKALQKEKAEPSQNRKNRSKNENKGLSYNENREYRKLEQQIEDLESRKKVLESQISSGELDHEELREKSQEYAELEQQIETHTVRWFELAERR